MYCIIRTHNVLFLSILFVTLLAQRTHVKTFVSTRQVYTRRVVVIIAFPSFFLFIQTEGDKRARKDEKNKQKKKKKKKEKKEIEHIIFPLESQLVLGILRRFQTSGNR